MFKITETDADKTAALPNRIGISVQYEQLHTILYKPFYRSRSFVVNGPFDGVTFRWIVTSSNVQKVVQRRHRVSVSRPLELHLVSDEHLGLNLTARSHWHQMAVQ